MCDRYNPCPQNKLVNVVLGDADQHVRNARSIRPELSRFGSIPAITLQPDWMDRPYGLWADYGRWKPVGRVRCSNGTLPSQLHPAH